MGEPVCEARDITFAYDRVPVLRDVGLRLGAGRFGALLGPNGSGKSTLLRCLLGRLRPGSGSVHLDGRPLERVPPLERARRLGYLPQEVHAAYRFTVAEVAMLGRYPHLSFGLETERDQRIAHACLARTAAEHLAARDFGTLSGGEKQRVLLASVLAQEPAVLLLDEPTAALDIHHQHQVMELLASLCSEGIAVLMVTHDLNLAARWCDECWLLGGGHLVGAGAPVEVLTAERLSEVYGEPLRVATDPDLGGPLVLPPLPRGGRT